MESLFIEHIQYINTWWLLFYILICIFILAKSADLLVVNAVNLSYKIKLPRIIIGATIISVGTTLPEIIVSVTAAIQGFSGLVLGNSVGSIICDTGLILGIACLINPIQFEKSTLQIQSWIQWGCGVCLIIMCIPWLSLSQIFNKGGTITRIEGILLVIGLIAYILFSIKNFLNQTSNSTKSTTTTILENTIFIVTKIFVLSLIVVGLAKILIILATQLAYRLNIPESLIAVSLVAFGTSLPELITAVIASIKKHGDLALGNILGADILNVLSVTGISATITTKELTVEPYFFIFLLPAMLIIFTLLKIWISYAKTLNRILGIILILVYLNILFFSLYYNLITIK